MAIAERPKHELQIRASGNSLAVIESIVDQCNLQTIGEAGQFARAFTLAAGMKALKEAITPEMMKDIMQLQGTNLGFRTDKDSNNGYSEQTVKLCLIEAVLMGAYPVGNEFNIISERPYMTKEFYTRKLREFPGLTDLRPAPGVPAMVGDRGALVPFTVTWKLDGKPMKIERIQYKLEDGTVVDERIPVKVNSGMGADAILGKATRKIYKAIYDLLTGSNTSDGEADDVVGSSTPPARRLDDLTKRLTNGSQTEPHDADRSSESAGEEQAEQAEAEQPQQRTMQDVGNEQHGMADGSQALAAYRERLAAAKTSTDCVDALSVYLSTNPGEDAEQTARMMLDRRKEEIRAKRSK